MKLEQEERKQVVCGETSQTGSSQVSSLSIALGNLSHFSPTRGILEDCNVKGGHGRKSLGIILGDITWPLKIMN